MYFYVLKGPVRVGFGVTGNFQRRQKDYTGAWGYPAEFSSVWMGSDAHVKHLEDTIKTQHHQLLWRMDRWITEWFDTGWDSAAAEQWVDQQIALAHLDLVKVF